MSSNRQFLTEDILAMSPLQQSMEEVLKTMSEEGLYALWRDLVNLTVESGCQGLY